MTSSRSTITIHMVSSLDGFIASPDGDVEWMRSSDQYEKGKQLTEEDIEHFLKGIDCYVMGSRTYELALALGWPYGEVPVIVLTKRNLMSDKANVSFQGGDLRKIIEQEIRPKYANIWMVGGTMLTKEFLQQQLADKIVISIMPILLGHGKLFFDFIQHRELLHLEDVTAYQDGMVELSYEIKKQ